jgi:D-lactate dehydrogenase (cytochrome)
MTGLEGDQASIEEYPDFLRDESRRTGRADSISFPRDEGELVSQLRALHAQGVPVTVQGARTGITAGAVPEGGHVLNLSRMNRILGPGAAPGTLRVQPGVLLSELRAHVSTLQANPLPGGAAPGQRGRGGCVAYPPPRLFFPPDPTETSATIGGMAANNASGAQSFHYGPTRRYIEGARVVLADGDILDLRRGERCAQGRHFELITEGGRTLAGELPAYTMPPVKSAAGYYAADDMDLLDLFIGSEGTLGVFSELELRLVPAPTALWGVMGFFPGESEAVRFVREIRQAQGHRAKTRFASDDALPGGPAPRQRGRGGCDAVLAALEFFDHHALDLLRSEKSENPAFEDLPAMPEAWHTAVYLEYHADAEEDIEAAVVTMSETLDARGGDSGQTWLASDAAELDRLKAFRHAVPEAVNLRIDARRKAHPELTKLGTDLAAPDTRLTDALALYHAGLDGSGLEYVIFGHIGDNHVHVNILPRDLDEFARGKALYIEWARAMAAMGGTVSAEHGIGKLKVDLLRVMIGDTGMEQMRAVKRLFDPAERLNRGNVIG